MLSQQQRTNLSCVGNLFIYFFFSQKSEHPFEDTEDCLFPIEQWRYEAAFHVKLHTILCHPKLCQDTHKYKSVASAVASHHLLPTQTQENVPSAFAFSSLSPDAKGHSVKLECARRTESWDFLWGSCECLATFRLAHRPGWCQEQLMFGKH